MGYRAVLDHVNFHCRSVWDTVLYSTMLIVVVALYGIPCCIALGYVMKTHSKITLYQRRYMKYRKTQFIVFLLMVLSSGGLNNDYPKKCVILLHEIIL